MDNFIRVYQNAFSDELCDRLISKLESTELEERERHDLGEMHFSQVNFRACGWKQEQEELVHIFLSHTKRYTQDLNITSDILLIPNISNTTTKTAAIILFISNESILIF